MNTSLSLLARLNESAAATDWQRLHQLYEPLLRSWARRSGVIDSDDVIQEVMLVLVRELPSFERRREGSFRAWLRSILVNRIREHYRDRNRLPLASESMLAELTIDTSAMSQLWDREHDLYIAKRLMNLIEHDFHPTTWRAFRLQVIDGRTAQETAQELNITINAALLAKSRILKRLREESHGMV